jgi:hypothetical protein
VEVPAAAVEDAVVEIDIVWLSKEMIAWMKAEKSKTQKRIFNT